LTIIGDRFWAAKRQRQVRERAGALLVSGDSFLVAQRNQLVALAARHAVPTLYHRREFTAVGGLTDRAFT